MFNETMSKNDAMRRSAAAAARASAELCGKNYHTERNRLIHCEIAPSD
jgi:hypothetical protein